MSRLTDYTLRALAAAIALLGLPAAAQAQLSAERAAQLSAERAQMRRDIGRTFWIENPWGKGLELCPSMEQLKECVRIAHTPFTITDVGETLQWGNYALAFYVIRLPDGRTGVTLGPRFFFHFVDPVIENRAAATDCKARGKPEMWMSREQVERTCWGKPSRVQKLTTHAGTKEILLYSSGNSVELYKDTVTAITEQE
jgi:hypothetical protein